VVKDTVVATAELDAYSPTYPAAALLLVVVPTTPEATVKELAVTMLVTDTADAVTVPVTVSLAAVKVFVTDAAEAAKVPVRVNPPVLVKVATVTGATADAGVKPMSKDVGVLEGVKFPAAATST
jgi:hypothetical protein